MESGAAKRSYDRLFGGFLSTLIVLNVLAVVLETVQSLNSQYQEFFHWFDVASVTIFSVEYLIRLWVSVEGADKRPLVSRLKFMVTPMAIIDLLAILPFFLPLIFQVDLRFLRAMRLFRVVRVLKLGRYSKSMRILGAVLRDKTPDLIVTVTVGLVLLTISASAMYFFEHQVQPEVFSSIPAAMWWAVSTLTTVGYGDVYPITTGGKIFGSVVAMLGVGLIALPAGILGAGLIESLDKSRDRRFRCPHCGKGIEIEEKKAA